MRKQMIESFAPGGEDNWQAGVTKTFNLAAIAAAEGGLITGIDIIVEGDFTLDAAKGNGVQFPVGGVFNLLKQVEVTMTDQNVTPAIGREVDNETLIRLPGWCFGMRGSPDATLFVDGVATPPGLGGNSQMRHERINLMQAQRLLFPGVDFVEPDLSNGAAQKIKAIYRIPFTLPRGLRPGDLWLDMDFVRQMQIKLQCGVPTDIYKDTYGGATAGGSTFVGDIKILPVTLQPIDTPDHRGSGHISTGILRARRNTIPISGNNAAFPYKYDTTANIFAHWLITQSKQDNAAGYAWDCTDGVLNSLRLQRGDKERFDLPASLVRARNARQMFAPGAAKVESANRIHHIMDNSGLYCVNGFPSDYDVDVSEALFPFMGNADDSTFLYMDYDKLTNDTQIEEVLIEFVPNADIAALSRPLRNLNANERSIAEQWDANAREKAQVQMTARNGATPTN